MKLKVNDKAPDFNGTDQNENKISLKDYENKWLLLYFYPKDDTPGCIKEACNFRDNLKKLKTKLDIVGVSADNLESHKKFSEKYNLNFPIIPDPDRKVINDYSVSKRTSFLIGPGRKVKKIYEGVNPDRHVQEVLTDLRELI